MAGAVLKKESPVRLLELKFMAWVIQQPEWLQIVAMPRQQRRASMKELANRLYTIPAVDGANTVPRVQRRKAAKQLAHAVRTGILTEEVQEALVRAAQLSEAEASVALDGETQSVDPRTEEEKATEGGVLLVEEPSETGGKGVSLRDGPGTSEPRQEMDPAED